MRLKTSDNLNNYLNLTSRSLNLTNSSGNPGHVVPHIVRHAVRQRLGSAQARTFYRTERKHKYDGPQAIVRSHCTIVRVPTSYRTDHKQRHKLTQAIVRKSSYECKIQLYDGRNGHKISYGAIYTSIVSRCDSAFCVVRHKNALSRCDATEV